MSLDIIHPRNQGGDGCFFESYAERRLRRDPAAAARARQVQAQAFATRRKAEDDAAAERLRRIEAAATQRECAEAKARISAALDARSRPPRPPASVRAIIGAVAKQHRIPIDALTGSSRRAPLVWARQEAMWRLRIEKNLSFPQIARFVGRSDHTTALHGVRKHVDRFGESVAVVALAAALSYLDTPQARDGMGEDGR